MSAQPNPSPSNRRRDLIQTFRDDYALCIESARVSAQHTATPGWRNLITEHRQAAKEARIDMAKRLRLLAQASEMLSLNEDDEKGLKEIAKQSAALRDTEDAFQREVLDRILAPVTACEKTINNAKADAERVERDAPLHHVGLLEILKHEISKLPRAVWREDDGVVEIVEPGPQ